MATEVIIVEQDNVSLTIETSPIELEINVEPVSIEINSGGLVINGVESVTGFYVDNTDPNNPIVDIDPLEQRVEDLENLLASQYGFTGYAYAVWTGSGLIFDVYWPAYYIQGIRYDAGTGQVTLDPADPTNPRLDVIGVDTLGQIKITGTPAVDPVKPTVDPLTQLEITTVLVAAGATTPTEITDETVYNENTEWTGSSNNGTVNFASATSPGSGSVCTDVGAFNNTHNITYTDGATHDLTDFSLLTYLISLKTAFSAGATPTYLRITLFNGGTQITSTVNVTTGNYNFVRTNISGYQSIVIPTAAFTIIAGSTFDRVRITFNGSNASGFRLDNIRFQTGTGVSSPSLPSISTIATDSGTFTADIVNDVVSIVGAGGATTSVVGDVITVTQKNQAIPYANLAAFPVTGTTGVIYMAEDSNFLYRWDGATYVQVGGTPARATTPATFLGLFKISTDVTPPPASGRIEYNNATQISATSLTISHFTDGGIDIEIFYTLLSEGTIIIVQDADLSENYQFWQISGAPTDNGAYWTFPVTLLSSGGTGTSNFANNHEVFIAVYSVGGGGHEILDQDGNPLAQEPQLQFVRLDVTAGTGKTVVTRPADTFMGESPPTNPVVGDVWTHTGNTTWKTYVRYDGYWVERHANNREKAIQANVWFNLVTTIDQDIFLYAATIIQITKTAGVATAEYRLNAGAWTPITFSGNTWTGGINVAANDTLSWKITYTGGYTSATLSYLINRA